MGKFGLYLQLLVILVSILGGWVSLSILKSINRSNTEEMTIYSLGDGWVYFNINSRNTAVNYDYPLELSKVIKQYAKDNNLTIESIVPANQKHDFGSEVSSVWVKFSESDVK